MDLAEAFTEAGLEVLACASAEEARRAYKANHVDLVVLDILLPDADGIDLLRELRTGEDAPPPVLILSSEAEVKDRIRGLRTGADEFVGKPYDRSYVVSKARELLRSKAATPQPGGSTVLVIDDSPTFRESLRSALTVAGHAVLTAATGEDGLRIAAEARPAAILVDGVLPGIDGPTVVRRVRLDAALRRTPCLLLTASEGKGAELRALDAGADDFVRKDEDMEVILARVSTLLRSSAAAEHCTSSLLAPKRILAVDDSATYLDALSAVLREEGYDVVLARSGQEALDLLSVQPVDCILLDVVMVGLSGQETCRRIKAAPGLRDTPLILLTALEDREVMIECLATGADDYISKSSEFEVLKARISAQLRRRQFEDETRRMRAELFDRELEATEARAARQIAESRAALVAELEQANGELEAFSYSVSHDLRGPLRAVIGFCSILREDHASALSDEGRELLEKATRAGLRMNQLIDDLLVFARLSRQPMKKSRVDVASLVQEVLDDLQPALASSQVAVIVGHLADAVADGALLKQVFTNLLSNAFKFTSRRERPVIEVDSRTEEGVHVYRVRDNGAGFDMKFADKLFGVFQRMHSREEFEGTGVGLSLTQRIVHRHGGKIWAEAEIDKGATFSFTLPS
jgi:DNA-binding response OmpR family regulator